MTEATSNLGISAIRCAEILRVDKPNRLRMDIVRLMIVGDGTRTISEMDVDKRKA